MMSALGKGRPMADESILEGGDADLHPHVPE